MFSKTLKMSEPKRRKLVKIKSKPITLIIITEQTQLNTNLNYKIIGGFKKIHVTIFETLKKSCVCL